MNVGDEAVGRVADALVAEVKKWPMDSSLPWDSRVGVGATFHELARVALDAALPHLVPSRERVVEVLRMHRIECTGPGEVTCGGCRDRSWMSWWDYHQHIADAMLALFSTTSTEGETQVS